MEQRLRIRWVTGLAVFVLGLWLTLPMLLPELTLTQRPREFSEPAPALPTPMSHVSLTVEVPLRELEQRLTRELDASLARKREDRDFQAWRSGPLRLQVHGHVIQLTLPLSFKSSEGPNTKGSLIVHTRLTADIAQDWRPRVSASSTFDWVKKPKIKVLFFKVRVSGAVGRALSKKLRELDADLKRKVESALTLRPRAEAWWQELHQPELLTENPPIWLTVVPQVLYFEPPNGNAKNVRLGLGIRAHLSTTMGPEPEATSLLPLPALARSTADEQGFSLYLPVLADYKGLAEKLREELSGREIQLERGSVTPTDFTLYTSGRSLVVGVEFSGDAPGFWLDTRGTVYFIGEPRFDPNTRILRIENFQFTRRLNNPLLSTATWVLHDSLREQMQSRLTWDLNDRLHDGARELSQQLNKPLGENLHLSGQVDHLNLTGIECRAEGIQLGLEARGQLKVTLAEPPAKSR